MCGKPDGTLDPPRKCLCPARRPPQFRPRLETFFNAHGVQVVVHDPGARQHPDLQRELVEDLLSIVTSFSGRLYGLRSHAKARALVQAVKDVVAS